MMRRVLIICCLFACKSNFGQYSNYSAAAEAYRNLKYDSALIYIEDAIRFFHKKQDADSLLFAQVKKADMVWSQQGNRPALAILDRALKISRKVAIHSIARVAALNKKAQILVHNAEEGKAEQYFKEALQYIPKGASPNPVYGSLYTNISWLYMVLQDFEPALHYAEEARKVNESLFGKDARQLTSVYQALFFIAHDAGWYNRAEQYGLEMYRLANLNFEPGHPSKGLVHNDLGTFYESMHRLDEALFHRRKMVDIIQLDYAKHKNPQLLAIAYNNMGSLYSTLGEFQLAEEFFEKALHLHEINFGAKGAGYVRPLVHLANAKKDIGSLDESEKLYAQAYSLQKEVDDKDWRNMAYVETQYGDLFFETGRYTKAEAFYKRALHNEQKAGILHTAIVEQTRTTLAETYARTGRMQEALRLLNEVLIRHRKSYPKGHVVIAGHYDKISQTYFLNNRLVQAMHYSDSVFLELLQLDVLPETNWVQLLPYEYHINRYIQHRSEIEAALYKENGNSNTLQNSINIAVQYGDYLEKSLPAIRTQASLIQLAKTHRKIYNLAIEACWELYQKGGWRQVYRAGF